MLPLKLILLLICFSMPLAKLYPQSSTCLPGNVQNNKDDLWSNQCYLKNDCTVQGTICKAYDVTVNASYLANATGGAINNCNEGQINPIYLYANFFNRTNTSRYAVRVMVEVFINNDYVETINSCAFEEILPGNINQLQLFGPFNYQCGDVIQLRNLWIAWDTTPSDCLQSTSCNQYSPSKCHVNLTESLDPINAFYTYECTNMNDFEIQFNSSAGLQQPYNAYWDFGTGVTSTELHPVHTFPALNSDEEEKHYMVYHTLVDSNGNSTSSMQEIAIAQCQLFINPVKWGRIESVEIAPNLVKLSWQTYMENENDHFIVQAKHWENDEFKNIGEVGSKGNSRNIQYYQFDHYQYSQTTYYRIKQVDKNGQASYSDKIQVNRELNDVFWFKQGNDILVAIHPTLRKNLKTIKIINALGAIVRVIERKAIFDGDDATILIRGNHNLNPKLYFMIMEFNHAEIRSFKVAL